MTKIMLHIGQHKTGSSSIQATLDFAQKRVQLKKWRYLQSDERNHSFIISSAFGSESYMKYYKEIKSSAGIPRKRFGKRFAQNRIFEEIQSAKKSNLNLIVSAEDLCILHESEVAEMRKFFVDSGATSFSVVGYIRPVAEWSNSFSQQLIRQSLKTISDVIDLPPYPRYREYFEKYISTFGRENVDIRPFYRKTLHGEDVVSDFLSILSEDSSSRNIKLYMKNDSMTVDQIRLASAVNEVRFRSNWKDGLIILRHLRNMELPKKERFGLPAYCHEMAIRSAESDINWASESLNLDKAFLSKSAFSVDASDLSKPVDAEMFVRYIRHLEDRLTTLKKA
ncbi:hypothetical protein [Qingshengfaniella alkalisoli]|uniref:Uncharacterized protein n=1 Tax=Qingshengfaniella alkalisoli TaxID=2599296 RepID=A0A5B8J0K5_9RHOB|nr:hypothetical protein [Qingshengfaniella alkalisoli]QDY70408.1 hypothetical protein FPZ52_11840 [Qingshengfaniella alkalisoli]